MAMRNIDDYKDRMESPIGIKVTTEKPEGSKKLEVIYKEPASYFTEEMLQVAEEWDREHGRNIRDERKGIR